jgi:hypothetical protein
MAARRIASRLSPTAALEFRVLAERILVLARGLRIWGVQSTLAKKRLNEPSLSRLLAYSVKGFCARSEGVDFCLPIVNCL